MSSENEILEGASAPGVEVPRAVLALREIEKLCHDTHSRFQPEWRELLGDIQLIALRNMAWPPS